MLDMTRGALYATTMLLLISFALFGATLLFTSREVARTNAAVAAVRASVLASCQFDADIGTAPVTTPAGARPSRLGVTIISDARQAWHGLGCPGTLPAPARSFTRWAAYYRLPAS